MTNGYRLVREPKGKVETKWFLRSWAVEYKDSYYTWASFKRAHHVIPAGDGINIKVRKIRTDVGKLRKSKQIPLSDYAHQPVRPAIKKTRWHRFYNWSKGLLWGFLVLLLVLNFTQIFGTPIAHADEGVFNANLSAGSKTEWRVIEQPKLADNSVEGTIRKYFGKDSDWAFRCLKSENGKLNPYAKNYNRNGSIDRGIFQVNSVHCGKVKGDCEKGLFDVETNVKIAKQIFDTQGKRAWYGKTCR